MKMELELLEIVLPFLEKIIIQYLMQIDKFVEKAWQSQLWDGEESEKNDSVPFPIESTVIYVVHFSQGWGRFTMVACA